MQKSRAWLLVLAVVAAMAPMACSQNKPSPAGETSVSFADGKTVTIKYSRPSMRGRQIFGGLVPYDQVWRTGANEATSLVTDTDLVIGGTNVPKGSYTLYSLPGQSGWKLIINKQTGQWGTKYDQSQDLARIDMHVTKLSSPMEQFTISLDKAGADAATLKLQWADTGASVDVKEKK